jgi:hypothetical protein
MQLATRSRKAKQRTCANCEHSLGRKRTDAVYCSHACRQAAYQIRKDARRARTAREEAEAEARRIAAERAAERERIWLEQQQAEKQRQAAQREYERLHPPPKPTSAPAQPYDGVQCWRVATGEAHPRTIAGMFDPPKPGFFERLLGASQITPRQAVTMWNELQRARWEEKQRARGMTVNR